MHRCSRRPLLLALIASAVLVPSLALAKGPVTGWPLILNPATAEATVARGNLQVGVQSGVPRTLYNVGYAVRAGAPEVMARQYLAENRTLLRLADPALSDLVV